MLNDTTARKAALLRPFDPDRIEWRIQSSGLKSDGLPWARVLAYITQRAAFERLDEVYGESWSMEETFQAIGNNAVCVCRIDIEAADNMPARTVSGTCAVDFDKAGDIDPFKTAASGALKRAVVSLGVGRYLYDLDEAWAEVLPKGGLYSAVVKDKDGTKHRFTWNPPKLPEWALPAGQQAQAAVPRQAKAEDPQDQETPPYEEPEAYSAPSPRPEAAPRKSAQAPEEDPVIPFGRSKGSRLSELSLQDLDYFANKWQPRPWEKTGKVTAKDQNLKDRALELFSKRSQPGVQASDPMPGLPETDEVPF